MQSDSGVAHTAVRHCHGYSSHGTGPFDVQDDLVQYIVASIQTQLTLSEGSTALGKSRPRECARSWLEHGSAITTSQQRA